MLRLRVLSYNVRSLRGGRAAVARAVRDCAPDLVAVQEAPRAVRVEVERVVERRLPRTPGQPLRGLAAAAVRVNGARLGVVGVHLGLSAAERRRQVGLLARTARGLRMPEVLLAGDLNEPAGGPSWRALAGHGFADPQSGDGAPTFPARDPRTRIDAVLASGRARVREYTVPEVVASDHRPVLAVVELG